jgi:hypothetical protein
LYQIYNHDVFGTGFNEWVPQRMKWFMHSTNHEFFE